MLMYWGKKFQIQEKASTKLWGYEQIFSYYVMASWWRAVGQSASGGGAQAVKGTLWRPYGAMKVRAHTVSAYKCLLHDWLTEWKDFQISPATMKSGLKGVSVEQNSYRVEGYYSSGDIWSCMEMF